MDRFSFNSNAQYKVGGAYPRLIKAANMTNQLPTIADNSVFQAVFPNVWRSYRLPKANTNETYNAWMRTPMQFWQNQLNFAMWCASAGCGVSVNDHINGPEAHEHPLLQSVYLFHLYYTTRRILKEMSVALPQDSSWNPMNNAYDRRAYERICDEFEVNPDSDWRQKEFPNSAGLGDVHIKGHTAFRQTDFRHDSPGRHISAQNVGNIDLERMTFGAEVAGGRHCGVSTCDWLPPKKAHIDYVEQDAGVDGAWSTFILDNSKGFTRAGMVRIDESIRTYVWAILGAQAQTKANIVKSFETQKQFLSNVEDSINSPVDIADSITRYQSVLQYAGSEVNFSFGKDLYMAPSDMTLRIAQGVVGYNNYILKATADLPLGKSNVQGPAIVVKNHGSFDDGKIVGPPTASPSTPIPHIRTERVSPNGHEEEKRALVVGGVLVGIAALWLAFR